MNKAQAKRLACWISGQYLINADHTGLTDQQNERLGEDDIARLSEATTAIGYELIARSGIPVEASDADAVAIAAGRRS